MLFGPADTPAAGLFTQPSQSLVLCLSLVSTALSCAAHATYASSCQALWRRESELTREREQQLVVLANAEVYKSPVSDTYVIFGEVSKILPLSCCYSAVN